MSRHLDELQNILTLLIDEHRKLLVEAEKHQIAVKSMDVAAMEGSRLRQETIRARITPLDGRRRMVTDQISAAHKIPSATLTRLAELNPSHRTKLLALRDELRSVIGQISQRTNVTGRVAGAVLGHLNTAVRLLAGAMQQAGLYTKKGVPKLARIGVIETVG